MPPSFELSIAENYVSAGANEARKGKSMPRMIYWGESGGKTLTENAEARQQTVNESNRWVVRGAAP
jgi:hypothetical protein